MTCTYDPSTERYSECDGHHRCICKGATMTYTPETVTATNSHAALAAEIARLRKAIDGALAELDQGDITFAIDILQKAVR